MPEPLLPVVISNTSPLLYLHRINRLDLLEQLYSRVRVPEQVADELSMGRKAGMNVPDVTLLRWCDIQRVHIPPALRIVPDLGAGEAGVIAVALETSASTLILLDDKLGRRIASLHQLRMTGTAGVLLRAKQKGLISSVRPLLFDLLRNGFYLRQGHIEMLLQVAGE